jgi:hypothetical protein
MRQNRAARRCDDDWCRIQIDNDSSNGDHRRIRPWAKDGFLGTPLRLQKRRAENHLIRGDRQDRGIHSARPGKRVRAESYASDSYLRISSALPEKARPLSCRQHRRQSQRACPRRGRMSAGLVTTPLVTVTLVPFTSSADARLAWRRLRQSELRSSG